MDIERLPDRGRVWRLCLSWLVQGPGWEISSIAFGVESMEDEGWLGADGFTDGRVMNDVLYSTRVRDLWFWA